MQSIQGENENLKRKIKYRNTDMAILRFKLKKDESEKKGLMAKVTKLEDEEEATCLELNLRSKMNVKQALNALLHEDNDNVQEFNNNLQEQYGSGEGKL